MSLFLAFEDCPHVQLLLEVGETIPEQQTDRPCPPWTTYPLDTGESISPGDIMTCITCDEPRKVKSAV